MSEEQQSLVEVRPLPETLMTRFDSFLVSAHKTVDESAGDLKWAEEFIVDSEPSFQVASTMMNELKQKAKDLDNARLEITRPIDDFKNQFTSAVKPALENYGQAVKVYTDRMRSFQRKRDEEEAKRQREAEAKLREGREKLEAEARKREEAAAKLKTVKAQQKALAEAETLRQTAAVIPESVALAPSLRSESSSERDNWKAKVKAAFMREALLWLADHPEWWCLLAPFKEMELKRFAKQFHNVPTRPECFEFWNETIYAAKAKR